MDRSAEHELHELAHLLADAARRLSDGKVPAGQRWLHTFQVHRLAGQLLRITPDDRGDRAIIGATEPTRSAVAPRTRRPTVKNRLTS